MTGLGLSSSGGGEYRPHHLRLLGPLRRRTDRPPRRFRRGVFLVPSAFTLANLFCGYACIVYAMRGDFETAAPFIGFAIVMDMLDGRIARMTGTATAFGVEFDSLADVVSFGVAPAILVFMWGLAPLGRTGWAAGFIFVTAGAVRLARFNIQHVTDKRYFVGMPIPAAAGILAATVYAYPYGIRFWGEAIPVLTIVIVPALLMVSTIRFRSFKTIDMQARRSPASLILLAIVLMAIVTHPKPVLVIVAYTYLVSAFVELAIAKLRRRPSPGHAAAPSAEAPPDQAATKPEEPAPAPKRGQTR